LLHATIFFFSSGTVLGGAERSLQELILELRRRGRRCVLVTPKAAPLRDWAVEAGLEHETLDMDTVRQRNPVKALRQVLKHRRFARDLLGKYGPGIFYSNTRHAFIMLACLPASYRKVAHHRDIVSRPSNRLLYPRLDCNVFISRFNYARSDAPSNGRVILNAGALDCDLPPVTLEPPPAPLKLAMFARITPYKGHALVLEASRLLRAAGINHQIDIWGDADGERGAALLRQLRDKVAQHDLPVVFRGFHPRPAEIIRAYHAILHPSFEEPFGRVPVEAFSLGVPAIAHASGGSLEIYAGLDDYRSYLFEDYTAESLCATLAALAGRRTDTSAERVRLERIRNHIRSRFGISRLVDEMEDMLADLFPSHGASRPAPGARGPSRQP